MYSQTKKLKKEKKKLKLSNLNLKKSKLISSKKNTSINEDTPTLSSVHLSTKFKSNFLKLTEENTIVTGYKGYSSVMSNIPIPEGIYYLEIKILEPKLPLPFENAIPHIRIGIANKNFNPDIALGSDDNSYSIRDFDGKIFHKGVGSNFENSSNLSFGEKDVVGLMIHLNPPQLRKCSDNNLENIADDLVEINYGSKLILFKNGKFGDIIFENLKQAYYYPGISLYMHSRAQFNFGPKFEFPPDIKSLDKNFKQFLPYSDLFCQEKVYKDIQFF